MASKQRISWTEKKLETAVREIATRLGHFPSARELRQINRHDISCQIARNGGFKFWASKIGMPRKGSDSDYGWEGEEGAAKRLRTLGFHVQHRAHVKCPFDLLVDHVLRVDVKTAHFATYGHSSGWFYRIGKTPQSDLIVLWQSDLKQFYAIPWRECPHSNVTITPTGTKYELFKNNIQLIRQMVRIRNRESWKIRSDLALFEREEK